MNKEVILIGAGGHAKVIKDIVTSSGDKVIGYLDDNIEKNTIILEVPVLGKISDVVKYKEHFFIIAIGNNYIRKKIKEEYNELNYYTAIHKTSIIGSDVKIGNGTVVMANSVINASAIIKEHCIINTASVIEHDNIIENYVHISPNASLGGSVKIGEKTHIGIGTVIKNNIDIAKDCIIGAGSVVVKDIKEEGIYMGIPAKRYKGE